MDEVNLQWRNCMSANSFMILKFHLVHARVLLFVHLQLNFATNSNFQQIREELNVGSEREIYLMLNTTFGVFVSFLVYLELSFFTTSNSVSSGRSDSTKSELPFFTL